MQILFGAIWCSVIAIIGVFLYIDSTRTAFVFATKNYPLIMGFCKFFVLATMGELLGRKISTGLWQLRGIRVLQRATIWGLLGMVFTFVFPIYGAGIKMLISSGRLPSFETGFLASLSFAFWVSFWMNGLFAFPMMVFHRITDTLIDDGTLLGKWPFLKVWNKIDWNNMWRKVWPTVWWFWVPAHTITFILPPEYRILMASALGIALGAILASAKKSSN